MIIENLYIEILIGHKLFFSATDHKDHIYSLGNKFIIPPLKFYFSLLLDKKKTQDKPDILRKTQNKFYQ